MWTQSEAIELCRKLEAFAPEFGYHVALTGGLLYKDGERKDCDIVLYRIRQVDLESLEWPDFEAALLASGFDNFKHHGFCCKATFIGKPVDLLFPEPCFFQEYPGNTPVEIVGAKVSSEPMLAAIETQTRISS